MFASNSSFTSFLLKKSTCVKFLLLPGVFVISLLLINSSRRSLNPHRKLYGANSVLYTEISPPAVIVRPESGQGNQLFRYACSFTLAKRLGIPLYLQVPSEIASQLLLEGSFDSSSDPSFKSPSSRPFSLHQFHIPMNHIITPYTYLKSPSSAIFKFNDEFLFNFDEIKTLKQEFSKPSSNQQQMFFVHDDYCESETFFFDFKDEIRKIFQPKLAVETPAFLHWRNLIQLSLKQGSVPIGIHVRRGDFVTVGGEFWVTPMSFFNEAIRLITQKLPGENIKFFVISDDIDNVKDNLKVFRRRPKGSSKDSREHSFNSSMEIFYISGGVGFSATTSLEEFVLMTLCSHMIISNSTFSWWAAYLIPPLTPKGVKKLIIAPKYHPRFFDHYTSDRTRDVKKYILGRLFYPPEWTVLDPYNKTSSSLHID